MNAAGALRALDVRVYEEAFDRRHLSSLPGLRIDQEGYDHHHDVWILQIRPRTHEDLHRAKPLRDEALAKEHIAQDFTRQPPAAALPGQRYPWPVEPPFEDGGEMVAHVLADTAQFMDSLDAVLGEDVGVADAGELKQLG